MGYNFTQPIYPPAVGDPPTDSRFVAHWSFDGTGADSVGGITMNSSAAAYARTYPAPSGRRHLWTSSTPYSATGAASLLLQSEVTICAWYYQMNAPTLNLAICGMRTTGGGSTYNFPWEIGVDTSGNTRFLWQHSSKVTVILTGPAPENGVWTHVIGTRNLNGDGSLYINGKLEAEIFSQPQPTGGSNLSVIRFLNSATGTELQGGISSVCLLNTSVDAGQAWDLYKASLSTQILEAV